MKIDDTFNSRKTNKISALLPVALFLLTTLASFNAFGAGTSQIGFWSKITWDKVIAGEDKTLTRYGNWFGPDWWGGREGGKHPGELPPVDDLDRIAQKHDFGYMLAEQLGITDRNIAHYYKEMADIIAAREVRKLNADPRKWKHPPKNVKLAERYRERIEKGFPTFWQHVNHLATIIPLASDKTDLDVINAQLDRKPGEKHTFISIEEFEKLADKEVQKWNAKYGEHTDNSMANKGFALDRAAKSTEAKKAFEKYGMVCTCEDWNKDGKYGVVIGKEILRPNYGTYEQCMAFARELPRCQSETAASKKEKKDGCDWSGTWKTDFKTLSLFQHGNSVTGTYTHQGGRVEGESNGCNLKGEWREDGQQKGCFIFSMAGDGQSFSGSWGYNDDCHRGSWSGTRQ